MAQMQSVIAPAKKTTKVSQAGRRRAASRIANPWPTMRRPPRRWVRSQITSFFSVHGVRMPMTGLRRIFPIAFPITIHTMARAANSTTNKSIGLA